MKSLFDPTEINHLKLKNRLFRSATWDGLAGKDGDLPDEVFDIYSNLAKGGVGTIITGLTDVHQNDQALPGNMRLYSDRLIPVYKRLTNIVHNYDCSILLQLNMNKFVSSNKYPHTISIDELSEEDISEIIDSFTKAAARAEKAGFDGVQIHLAYGWLLNRFVNPIYNHRTDNYGNTPENRERIVCEIIRKIRDNSDTHISAKFSFFAGENGSFDVMSGVEICSTLSKAGIDSIEVLGEHSPQEEGTKFESCYLNLALAVKNAVDAPVILTGNNHDIYNMELLLNEQNIEYFALCRPLIREPDLPNRWEAGNRFKAQCISCNSCYNTYGKRCIFVEKN